MVLTEKEKMRGACEYLDALNIDYRLTEHDAVFTIEEIEEKKLDPEHIVAKNLFLRDYKGKRHMLVVLRSDKSADLNLLREELASSRLSFASEERLQKYLGLTHGSVTPLGLINDAAQAVEVYFDEDLRDIPRIGVHPNTNTATIELAFSELVRLVEHSGHFVKFIRV